MQDFRLGEWQVSPTQNSLTRGKETRQLEHTPMQLLLHFTQNPGQILYKDALLQHIWAQKVVTEEVLTVAVSHIRKALGDNARAPSYIKTVPGKGYCLICAPSALSPHHRPESKKISWWYKLPLLLVIPLLWWFWSPLVSVTMPETEHHSAGQDLYNQGRFLLFSQEEQHLERADNLFEQALQKDPDLGSALWGKAMVLIIQADDLSGERAASLRSEAIQLLEQAELMSADNAAIQAQLGWLYFTHEWNFKLAGQKLERAIELDNRDATNHFLYAQYLMAMGQNDSALAATRRYIDLAPQYYSVPVVAWLYNTARQPQKAMLELEKIAALTEPDLGFHYSAIKTLESLGLEQRAFNHLLQSMHYKGFTSGQIADAKQQFATGGLAQVYNWLIQNQIRDNLGHYAAPLAYARYAIKANQPAQAIKWLQDAIQQRQVEVLWLAVDPYYDPLRLEPEFHQILKQLKLDGIGQKKNVELN
ncbi:hypothetical protein GCM10009092_23420 [Bowmanella denitrificans]|uniref:OmpR/PhoB-type domain-containing protein n=1 Tax=Bowmanella denitrificans TaxID=366582 RepID=A0ABN0X9D1_9ALTE|nr:winged helix-turn-helix domain-containing protein [Bowmanella denitrificans]